MALSKEEILDAIASMSVLEVSELIKMMEDKFGVSAAAAAVAVAAPAAGAGAVCREQLRDVHRAEPGAVCGMHRGVVYAFWLLRALQRAENHLFQIPDRVD